MENSNYVLVIGATGFLGMQICKKLIADGRKVKGMIRETSDPAKVNNLKNMGVETVQGDLKNIQSLFDACNDVSVIISTASSTMSRNEGDSIESVDEKGQLNAIEAALTKGVKQFIFISFKAVDTDFPLQSAKRNVENKLKESNLNYTILKPSFFMEVWLSPAIGFDYTNAKATVYGDGKNKIPWISLNDVANFTTACVDNPKVRNQVFEVGGPEGLSPLEVISIFENQSGKNFHIDYVPIEALQAQKESASDSLSQSFATMMLSYANGSVMDDQETDKIFGIKKTTVGEYTKQVLQN